MHYSKVNFNSMKYLLFVLAISVPHFAIAKSDSADYYRKNTIALSFAYTDFPRIEKLFSFTYTFASAHIADQFGVYYYRTIHTNLRVIAGYSAWNTIPILAKNVYGQGGVLEIQGKPHNYEKGSLIYYSRLNMCDAGLMYRYNRFDKHKIDFGIGASYGWSLNSYVDTLITGAPWEGFLYDYKDKQQYIGIFGIINYDYLFFRNILSAGAGLKYRKYSGFYSPQIDYDFHFSFNF